MITLMWRNVVWMMVTFSCAGLSQTDLSQADHSPEWTAAQSGWVYVLDVGDGPDGQVLLVDPATGIVRGSISTGYHPNLGICPDGARLFVTDGPQSTGSLSIFDVATGR